MEQLIAHLMGDFILQTEKQALGKKENFNLALQHALTYTIPFVFITQSFIALLVICITHAIIDYRPTPQILRRIINNSQTESGFLVGSPSFITVWLNIISDNTIHLLINMLAIKYL